MIDNIDPRIKREFDALIYSVLDTEKIVDSVVKRLHQRRRKLVLKIVAVIGISILVVASGYFFLNRSVSSTSSVVSVKSEESAGGVGLVKLPFSTLIDVDGNDPRASTFEFKAKLRAGQSILFWTNLRGLAVGSIGTMTAAAQMADGTFKDFQVYQIGSGTNRQEVGTRAGDGLYRFQLQITDKGVRGKMEVAITIISQ